MGRNSRDCAGSERFFGFGEAVVVDVKTTGLDPKRDRIVSVALYRVDFSELSGDPSGLRGRVMSALVNPRCRIPREASRIHGIRDRHVARAPSFEDEAQALRDFIGNLPVIGHNVKFDRKFLNAEFKRAGVRTLSRNKCYCTMQRYRELNGGDWEKSTLDDACEAVGAPAREGRRHDAVEDARLCAHVAAVFYMRDNGIEAPAPAAERSPLPVAGGCVALATAAVFALTWALTGWPLDAAILAGVTALGLLLAYAAGRALWPLMRQVHRSRMRIAWYGSHLMHASLALAAVLLVGYGPEGVAELIWSPPAP